MKKQIRIVLLFLLVFAMLLCSGCGQKAVKRSTQEIIEEMVVDYGSYGEEAEMRVSELRQELAAVDADTASRWERIMELWKSSNTALTIHCDEPTADLPDTDELCFVVLGFQLAPDGTMRDELIERLTVALRCAERYPNALIVCTGGGTAAEDETATEAGRMADWLIENGVDPRRVIVEDKLIIRGSGSSTNKYYQITVDGGTISATEVPL